MNLISLSFCNTIIEIGDKVIVFARHDSISEIEKIFSVGIGFY